MYNYVANVCLSNEHAALSEPRSQICSAYLSTPREPKVTLEAGAAIDLPAHAFAICATLRSEAWHAG